MNPIFFKVLSKLAIALCAATLCSCAIQDPMYLENVAKIQSVDYPEEKIVGVWADMSVSRIQTGDMQRENKAYYNISPGGVGKVRQASANKATGDSISLEANFTWRYLGENRWMITLPPSDQYQVTDSHRMRVSGYRNSTSVIARYYNEELYVTPGSSVWVKADSEHVSELARRLRSQPQILHFDGNARY